MDNELELKEERRVHEFSREEGARLFDCTNEAAALRAMLGEVCGALSRNQQGNVCKDITCNCAHGQNEAALVKAQIFLKKNSGEFSNG